MINGLFINSQYKNLRCPCFLNSFFLRFSTSSFIISARRSISLRGKPIGALLKCLHLMPYSLHSRLNFVLFWPKCKYANAWS